MSDEVVTPSTPPPTVEPVSDAVVEEIRKAIADPEQPAAETPLIVTTEEGQPVLLKPEETPAPVEPVMEEVFLESEQRQGDPEASIEPAIKPDTELVADGLKQTIAELKETTTEPEETAKPIKESQPEPEPIREEVKETVIEPKEIVTEPKSVPEEVEQAVVEPEKPTTQPEAIADEVNKPEPIVQEVKPTPKPRALSEIPKVVVEKVEDNPIPPPAPPPPTPTVEEAPTVGEPMMETKITEVTTTDPVVEPLAELKRKTTEISIPSTATGKVRWIDRLRAKLLPRWVLRLIYGRMAADTIHSLLQAKAGKATNG